MKTGKLAAAVLAGTWLALGIAAPARGQTRPPAPASTHTEAAVTRASGTFEVKMAPLETAAAPVGRMSLDKVFHGDLEATSKGEMLAFRTEVEGSAGYVAMERVTGTLGGRAGTFVLQHYGIMNRGAPHLTLEVVPDSGTGELAGISGSMKIIIEPGKHSYEFDYTLPGGS